MCFQIDRFIVRLLLFLILTATDAWALDGANPVFITKPAEVDNGWKTFEIITGGDELGARAVEGFVWTTAQHDDWDGLGAYRPPSSDTLRVFVNHEAGPGSTFSRVDLNVRSLKAWISAGIPNNTNINQVEPASNVVEVVSRGWSDVDSDATAPINNPCTGNVWLKDTFGPGFGFADSVYLTGEEVFSTRNGHIWVMDLATRTLYEAPHLGDGSWENATIIDTGRTDTVAILLSEDNGSAATGTAPVVLYVGAKDPNSADLEFVAGDLSATARNSTIRVLYAASTQASKTNDFGGMDNLVWSPARYARGRATAHLGAFGQRYAFALSCRRALVEATLLSLYWRFGKTEVTWPTLTRKATEVSLLRGMTLFKTSTCARWQVRLLL